MADTAMLVVQGKDAWDKYNFLLKVQATHKKNMFIAPVYLIYTIRYIVLGVVYVLYTCNALFVFPEVSLPMLEATHFT